MKRPLTIREMVLEFVRMNEMPPDLGAYILTLIVLSGGNLDTRSNDYQPETFTGTMEKFLLEEFGLKAVMGPVALPSKFPHLN